MRAQWFLFILFIPFCGAEFASAQGQTYFKTDPEVIAEDRQENFSFSLKQAIVGSFTIGGAGAPSGEGAAQTKKLLAVTFELFNGDTKRKIDLSRDFNYSLKDEFSNTYQIIPAVFPLDHAIFPEDVSPESLYPNSVYRRTIFFEPPISAARNFTLTISSADIDRGKPIVLQLSAKHIRALRGVAHLPQEKDFQIIGPSRQTAVRPGSIVHIGIRFPADIRRPNSVYIISPDYFLEDVGCVYQYDVRVPKNHPAGSFEVVVMAKWGKTNDIVLSKSVTFEVRGEANEIYQQ